MASFSIGTVGLCPAGCGADGGEDVSLCPEQGWEWQGVPRQQHGVSCTQSEGFRWSWRGRDTFTEMINSLFADLLQELEGAEKWIGGWGVCVRVCV